MKLLLVMVFSCGISQAEAPPAKPESGHGPLTAGTPSAESILKTLLAANVTNSTQYLRGQMSIRLRTETCLAAKATVYDMVVRWSGQSVSCDFVQRELPKSAPETAWAGAPTMSTPALTRLVTTPGANTTIYRLAGATGPGSHPQFVFFTAGRESMDIRDFQLRPDQAWFNIDRMHQLRFLLESILAQGKADDSMVRVQGSRVILGGADARAKKKATIEFSLEQGGNAVKHENWNAKSSRSEYGSRGTWSWAQLPDQRWYLKSMESEVWSDDLANPKLREIYETNRQKRPKAFDPDWESKPSWKMRLDVHEFNPDAKWDVDPFDPSRWQVASGTMVDDRTGPTTRRYKFGQDTSDPTAEINALVERLKKRKR